MLDLDHPCLDDDARTPPEAVSDAARLGLELRARYGRGGTEVGVRRAERLIDREPVSDRDIKSIYSYFARHAVDSRARGWGRAENPSTGWIAWHLWGGDPGRTWIDDLRARLREVGI